MNEKIYEQFVVDMYLQHHQWLNRWLRSNVNCTFLAEDMVQDTFVRLLVGKFDQQRVRQSPRTLLAHIAKGIVVNFWRRQEVERAYQLVLLSLPEPVSPSAESCHMLLETIKNVSRLLESMDKRVRQVFLLAQVEGMTQQQIASQLDMPVITVRRYIRKALMACMTVHEEQ